jgi:hypothetical protein
MLEATDVLSAVEIRSTRTSVSGDTAWLVEFAKFVTMAYDRAVLAGDSLELRALIRHVTRHLRNEEVPPERALATVKALLPAIPRANDTFGVVDARRVRDDAIRWCIVEYYAEDTASVREPSHY